jgi:hypothetical protein
MRNDSYRQPPTVFIVSGLLSETSCLTVWKKGIGGKAHEAKLLESSNAIRMKPATGSATLFYLLTPPLAANFRIDLRKDPLKFKRPKFIGRITHPPPYYATESTGIIRENLLSGLKFR